MPVAVLVLGLTVFGLGTTEFMVAGLLPELSVTFNVTAAQVGMLITAFAIAVAVGAPAVTAATTRIPRKVTLVWLLVVFTAGSALATFAPSFGILMTARVVTAVAHGAFFGIAAVVASELVDPGIRGRALAIMFGGLTVATIAGVPLGTALGDLFGWRAAFGAVTILAVISLVAVMLVVPRHPRPAGADLSTELAAFNSFRLWRSLLTTALAQAAVYVAYSYVSPLLIDRSGFAPQSIPWLLVVFGLGTLIGSILGGSFADHALKPTIVVGCLTLAVVLVVMTPASSNPVTMIIALLLFGVAAFVINPGLQAQVMNQTTDAPTLASSANISAFNIGNALGPWLGGIGLSVAGVLAPTWIGAVLALLAALVAGLALLDARRRRRGPAAEPDHL